MNREEAEKILTHGEWFYAESFDGVYKGVFKHDEIISGGFDFIKFIRCVVLVGTAIVEQYYEHDSKSIIRIDVRYINHLRPATKDEVLKYFPDEVLPEPKERFKVPIIKAPSLKDELKDIMEALRYKGEMDFTNPIPPRKRPITRNKKKYILR